MSYKHVLHTITTVAVWSLQTFLVFNKEDSSQLVSNSEDTVVFYSWVKYPPYTHGILHLLYSIFAHSSAAWK